MLHHPTPTWGSKLNGTHWSSAQPPYYPPKRLILYLWLFFAAWGPLVEQSPFPRSPSPFSSSSSLG